MWAYKWAHGLQRMLWLNNIQIWIHRSNRNKTKKEALQSLVFPLSLSLFLSFFFSVFSISSIRFDTRRKEKKKMTFWGFWVFYPFRNLSPVQSMVPWHLLINNSLLCRKIFTFFSSLCLQSVCLYSSENPKFVKKKERENNFFRLNCCLLLCFRFACFLDELVIKTLSSYPHCYLFLVTFSIWVAPSSLRSCLDFLLFLQVTKLISFLLFLWWDWALIHLWL